MRKYRLHPPESEYDHEWISAPNDGGDIGDMEDIVSELNRLLEERNVLAKLAADTPQFFNPLEAMAAKKLRDDILSNVRDDR
jgi:hypothetical protein